MEDIQSLRQEIDQIDQKIVALFNKRLAVAYKVAKYKKEHQLNILDQKREDELLEKIKNLSQKEYVEETLRLYENILVISKDYQKKNI